MPNREQTQDLLAGAIGDKYEVLEWIGGGGMAGIKRRRVYEILDAGRSDISLGRTVDIALIALISLNVIAVILESVSAYEAAFGRYFFAFEVFSVVLFTAEYICRVWSIVDHKNESLGYRPPLQGSTALHAHADGDNRFVGDYSVLSHNLFLSRPSVPACA